MCAMNKKKFKDNYFCNFESNVFTCYTLCFTFFVKDFYHCTDTTLIRLWIAKNVLFQPEEVEEKEAGEQKNM